MTYPSVYRAKAVDIKAGVITAFVPQVFGETTITVTETLSALPTSPEMGWVFFQAGNPEFPVWASSFGPSDTDEANPTDVNTARWKSAWGVVAYAAQTVGQSGIGATAVDLIGLSVSFTPVVGRRYRTILSFMGLVAVPGPTPAHVVPLITEATATRIQQRNYTFDAGSYYHHFYVEVVESNLPPTPTLRKGRANTSSGTVETVVGVDYPSFIYVEDVGPVSQAAP